jgi:hypothetical protein
VSRTRDVSRRTTTGFIACIAIPAALALDTLVAVLRGWRLPAWSPLPDVFGAAMVGAIAWLVLPCAALLADRGRAWFARHAPGLALASMSLIASTVLASCATSVAFDRVTGF